MKYEIKDMPTELVNNKVKVALSTMGLNERYKAFEYLSFILTYMIKNDTDSISDFEKAVEIVENRFNISKITVNYGIKKIMDKCKNDDILNKAQFKLAKNGIVNRVRVIKNFALQRF